MTKTTMVRRNDHGGRWVEEIIANAERKGCDDARKGREGKGKVRARGQSRKDEKGILGGTGSGKRIHAERSPPFQRR
jgi:hypothetical protein